MNSRNPWRISSLFSACYEFVLALFLLFQMLLALLVLEVAKFLPVERPCTCRPRHHNTFCSGHFPPFSPCRERDSGQSLEISGSGRTPSRFSRGLLPGRSLSEDFSSSANLGDVTFPRRTGVANGARTLSLSSPYRRSGKHLRSATVEESASACKGSADGETCQCIAAGLDLYDDLIEVSSEYLKQKDRGHEEVILSLLKALQVERKNLRILYEELEEERVAAETAANEAMAMILRLQEEKSALQMEADHYQRMAEEKALHDESAIQLLEEDLCRKENERLVLEEELRELRRRLSADTDDCDTGRMSVPCCSTNIKTCLLLTGIGEVSSQAEQENATAFYSQDVTDLKCVSTTFALLEEEQLLDQDLPVKRLKGFKHQEMYGLKESEILCEVVESVPAVPKKHPENFPSNAEDDAKAILVQLSAVEKQLLALEESENLELWQHTQVSRDSLICELLNPNQGSVGDRSVNNENNGNLQTSEDVARTLETETSTVLIEEKVVDVDVANVSAILYCETEVPDSEELIEIHEENRQRGKVAQWEASEEEKHLDLPSFVKINSSTVITSMLDEACKPEVQSLQGMGTEENWDAKRVTLEDINSRLRALESKSTVLQPRPVTSDHEHANLVLLKEIMQELQDLLKANRTVSASNEALTSLNADVKGEMQHKKRHYSDGPGQFS